MIIKAVKDKSKYSHDDIAGNCREDDCIFNEKGQCYMTSNFEKLELPKCNTGYHFIVVPKQ